ncbi:MAG: hypothetical protein LBT26_02035 [Clostridiales Family XIII bacterium]|nr:hypothetical protein [Clostridiales Family XIII bacterium]
MLKLEAASQVDSTYADLAEVFMRQLLDGAAYYALSELLLPVMEDRDAANLFLDALERRIRDLAVSQAAKQNGAVVSPGMLMEPAGTARRDLNMGINCKYAMKNMVLDMQGEREQHG